MKIRQIIESSAGATSSGSVASVAKPLGKMQERTNVAGLQSVEKVMKGKAKKKGPYANSTLAEAKKIDKSISEAELAEQDLIILPGMRKSKDKSFISHKDDRRDHEVEMARSDLLAAAKNAMRMYHLLKDRTEDQGLMGWQQSYITLATDYLQSVADNLEYDARTDEMTGGVLAGGMSNFEEGKGDTKYAIIMKDKLGKTVGAQYHDEKYSLKNVLSDILDYKRKGHKNLELRIDGEPVDWKKLVVKQGVKEVLDTPEKQAAYIQAAKKSADELSKAGKHKKATDRIIKTIGAQTKQITQKAKKVGKSFANLDEADVEEAKKQGLWANIHAKRERIKHGSGERMRKPGSKGAPTAQAFKKSQKTSKKK